MNLSGNRGTQQRSPRVNIEVEQCETEVVEGHNYSESEMKYLNIIRWQLKDLQLSNDVSAMDKLSLNDSILQAVKEIKRWNDSEQWYKDKNIPWKRGWLLYGKPGTGKTAFIRAIAQELNMPVMSFDLSSMTNKDLDQKWKYSISKSPVIVLFEDIDAVFDKRTNLTSTEMDRGITFDHLLNTIDGVNNTDGIFLIITTNNIDSIDDALGSIRHQKQNENSSESSESEDEISTRPGRIDRAVYFPELDQKGKLKMAKRIFKDLPEKKWSKCIDYSKLDTGAQFQERCSRLALKMFWENKES